MPCTSYIKNEQFHEKYIKKYKHYYFKRRGHVPFPIYTVTQECKECTNRLSNFFKRNQNSEILLATFPSF